MRFFYILLLLMNILLASPVKIDIHSIKADFTQTITNDENSTVVYHGTFFAKDNSKALWIYKKPIKKELYFLNGKVVIIEPELEQAIFSTMQKAPKIIDIIKNAKQNEKNFSAKCCGNRYVLSFNKNKIDSIKYKDKIGNKVLIKFTNEEVNLILDDKIFEYNIPSDYDLLEN